MSVGSGIDAQLGLKAESVYGTAVVVDRFYEFNSEAIETDVGKVVSAGIGRGRYPRADRVKTYVKAAKGPVELDVLNKSFGLIFAHAIGQDTITGAGANKTHTIIPDSAALFGKSLTVQVGRPDISGTVRPFTFAGGKVTDWELKAALDEGLKLGLGLDFASVATATGLASASYPSSQEQFIFSEGALTIGGTSIDVRGFSLKGVNGLDVDRRFLGNTKREAIAAAMLDINGTLDCEFSDLTAYAAWIAGTQAQLVLTFTTGTLIPTTAVPYSLTITIPKIEYTGESPKVGGPAIVKQGRPFHALYDGSTPIVTLAYVTDDVAA